MPAAAVVLKPVQQWYDKCPLFPIYSCIYCIAESFYADLKMEPDITFENDPVDTSLKEHVSSASTFDLC